MQGDARLSQSATATFLDTNNKLHLSAASYWEIAIKQSLGKLGLVPTWATLIDQEMTANNIGWLAIEKVHCQTLLQLPWHHRDPFDRLLISQAQYEGMGLLSKDKTLSSYNVKVIW